VADQPQVELLTENTLTNNNGDEVRLKRGGLPIRSCETELEVTPPCELSSPSLARCVICSELPPQFFSVWVQR
jgi:hypothetical protein